MTQEKINKQIAYLKSQKNNPKRVNNEWRTYILKELDF